jgi:hypothetical protein
MDASAMVRMARIWTTVPEQKISAVKADIGRIILGSKMTSVADPGMFVPDPNLFHPGSRSRIFSIPDPNFFHLGSRIWIKEFKVF